MMHGSFSVTGSDAVCVALSGVALACFPVDEAAERVLLTAVRTMDVGPPECRDRVDIRV